MGVRVSWLDIVHRDYTYEYVYMYVYVYLGPPQKEGGGRIRSRIPISAFWFWEVRNGFSVSVLLTEIIMGIYVCMYVCMYVCVYVLSEPFPCTVLTCWHSIFVSGFHFSLCHFFHLPPLVQLLSPTLHQ